MDQIQFVCWYIMTNREVLTATPSMARVLAGVRLSRSTDERTSPERQLAAVRRWAKSQGHDVVGQEVDLDVSAYKVAPWERPDIGDWLANRGGTGIEPGTDHSQVLFCCVSGAVIA